MFHIPNKTIQMQLTTLLNYWRNFQPFWILAWRCVFSNAWLFRVAVHTLLYLGAVLLKVVFSICPISLMIDVNYNYFHDILSMYLVFSVFLVFLCNCKIISGIRATKPWHAYEAISRRFWRKTFTDCCKMQS